MKTYFLITFSLLLSTVMSANNVTMSNISVTNNAGNTGKVIEFDVSWENSWRVASTNNYDGAWVFFKIKDTDGAWKHLNLTGTDNSVPAGVAYTMGNNGTTGVGIFIYRSSLGFGTFTALNIRAGVQNFPGVFDVKGFALEMVYIPQGSFYAGDGSWYDGSYTYQNGTSGAPYLVNSNTITFGQSAGQLNQSFSNSVTLTNFPTGYSAFWIMKYELSQGAYRDFLNTLSFAQQEAHMAVHADAPNGYSFNVVWYDLSLEIITQGVDPSTPAVIGSDANNNNVYNENGDGEWKAMGLLRWSDAAAYLDWAGLRPMTELEYEKACRGPKSAVVHEFAWGNALVSSAPYQLVNYNQANSSISNASIVEGNGNFSVNVASSNYGFYRGGIFSNSSSTRTSAGASYYGVMELSGNLLELVVSTAGAAGRSFMGINGNGVLDAAGYANEDYWPGINGAVSYLTALTGYAGTGVTNSAGACKRGGCFTSLPQEGYTSYRFSTSFVNNREVENGIRGVRN